MASCGRAVALVGAGYSVVGRNTGLTIRELTAQSIVAALADADISAGDVDGLSIHSFPWQPTRLAETARDVGMDQISWISGSSDGPAGITAAIHAASAVASGACEIGVAVRTVLRDGASGATQTNIAEGPAQFILPFGGGHPTMWAAMFMRRMMHEFGWSAESFGRQVVTQRRFAELNDLAQNRSPLTLVDYLADPFVSSPLRRLDCDYPVDASGALVFTTLERARDLRFAPVRVESYSFSLGSAPFEFTADMTRTAPHKAAQTLFERSDLTASDVDVAGLYDGFSPLVLNWIEALGFCARGEAAEFIEQGETWLGGRIPVNTDGGAANMGRIHGINFIAEMLWQLRGSCGSRQVSGAEVAVATGLQAHMPAACFSPLTGEPIDSPGAR